MVKTLIENFPKTDRIPAQDGSKILDISECFADTIQGENFTGVPSIFLRMQYCTLNCVWCDTAEVWRKGNKYSVDEVVKLFKDNGVIERLYDKNHHLVLTGGSPVRQQEGLNELIEKIRDKDLSYHVPFVEVENECTLMPSISFASKISRWNNSPKLANSGMKKDVRYKPDVIDFLARQEDSWFKFVIMGKDDWKEIEEDFINPGLIDRSQIVLMPEGMTREELQKKYQETVDLCCKEGVRMTDRFHVTIFDRVVGV